MLRTIFFYIATLSFIFSEEGLNRITIADQKFMIKTELYDLYDSKGKVLRLYQGIRDEEPKLLFSFTLNDTTGPCHEKSVEEGSYEVNGSNMIFYTLWDRYGNVDAPYGVRIKMYTVDANGAFKLLSSKIYIETERKSEAKKSAMQYLFKTPVTESEKEALQQYVKSAEQRFKGTFVLGQEAELLIKEVNAAIYRKRQNSWH